MKKSEKTLLSLRETQKIICAVKDCFARELAHSLNLFKVSAPLFVKSGTGINDDLNGIEKPVAFTIKADGTQAEIVHSLAKWKRIALSRYGCARGEGIYTDMCAIRADEECDAVHSLYVDQWDWEQVISMQDRTLDYLKVVVKKIYDVLRTSERRAYELCTDLKPRLPRDLHFIHSEDLAVMFPCLSRKDRENEICKRYGAVFLIGIGADLSDGVPHDGRAPDYDDWSTNTSFGYKGLNGDILVWDNILDRALELSSMGIRVDECALRRQLALRGVSDRISLQFHTMLLDGKLPLSIGGGIGQSRVCMFMLQKSHICHVQESVWPEHAMSSVAL